MAETDVPETPNTLTRAEVAEALGVDVDTVSLWIRMSKKGQLYAEEPFMAPDGKRGRSLYWFASRLPEMRAWKAARPRDGMGGPRKPKS